MIKRIDDYVDRLQEQFPNVPRKDIIRIINYGWRMFYFYNLRNCDTLVTRAGDFWMYCGQLTTDSVKHYRYYRKKLMRKIRVMYKKKKKQWDGYYYTAIKEEEYNKIKKKFGRPVTNLDITNRVLFKIKNEAFLFYDGWKYFIKCKMPIDYGYTVYKKKYKCKNVQVIKVRDRVLTLKDLIEINENEKRNN